MSIQFTANGFYYIGKVKNLCWTLTQLKPSPAKITELIKQNLQ